MRFDWAKLAVYVGLIAFSAGVWATVIYLCVRMWGSK